MLENDADDAEVDVDKMLFVHSVVKDLSTPRSKIATAGNASVVDVTSSISSSSE